MKIGVYLCRCGSGNDGQVSAKIDLEAVRSQISPLDSVEYVEIVDFACSEPGQEQIREQLAARRPDRVVIAACSPRQHEETFRRIMTSAGLNPYLLQMVNIREHVAWVTEDQLEAAHKATDQVRAGVARVGHQLPLRVTEVDMCPDVLVVGAGAAGLRTATELASAGRRVVLVEKSPILGGLPVRFEEIFPTMECAPCLLEPIMGEVLHGELPGPVEIHLGAEVTAVKGFLGNFDVQITTQPRYVSTATCVGCGMCPDACPVEVANPLNLNRTNRKAVDFEVFGGLPSVPVLDPAACTRFTQGSDCTACRDICPVEGAIQFDQTEQVTEVRVGAVVIATGAGVYQLEQVRNLGYGSHPDIVSNWDVERLLAANGPTAGELLTSDGRKPGTVAIVHCAGSMDPERVPYCSAICCQTAFKYAHLISGKAPDTRFVSYVRTIVAPGKEAIGPYQQALANPRATQCWYSQPGQVEVRISPEGQLAVARKELGGGDSDVTEVDMVILLAGVVPAAGTTELARLFEVGVDQFGFLTELNSRSDATRSPVRGVYLAGACQSPMDIQAAMTQGSAAAGHALSDLVVGRKLQVDPATATVDASRCSGCRTCVPLCPYHAIDFDTQTGLAEVNQVLCTGCGTCVAGCPAGAITGNHFTDAAIYAEIEAVLQS